mmetsp:Transcript_34788/g.48580  ORF Transcript_34788/g.48580 Transcript_34788/m.48580 type:complete len:352 (-) Transcript_34788:226-1281(-)
MTLLLISLYCSRVFLIASYTSVNLKKRLPKGSDTFFIALACLAFLLYMVAIIGVIITNKQAFSGIRHLGAFIPFTCAIIFTEWSLIQLYRGLKERKLRRDPESTHEAPGGEKNEKSGSASSQTRKAHMKEQIDGRTTTSPRKLLNHQVSENSTEGRSAETHKNEETVNDNEQVGQENKRISIRETELVLMKIKLSPNSNMSPEGLGSGNIELQDRSQPLIHSGNAELQDRSKYLLPAKKISSRIRRRIALTKAQDKAYSKASRKILCLAIAVPIVGSAIIPGLLVVAIDSFEGPSATFSGPSDESANNYNPEEDVITYVVFFAIAMFQYYAAVPFPRSHIDFARYYLCCQS